ncbi:hypothetical protein BDW02DRAFT_566087, partial [Decorospora gaudefroyi]
MSDKPSKPQIPDYYSDLAIHCDATSIQIKKAFHKLALKHHPDRKAFQNHNLASKHQSDKKGVTTTRWGSARLCPCMYMCMPGKREA